MRVESCQHLLLPPKAEMATPSPPPPPAIYLSLSFSLSLSLSNSRVALFFTCLAAALSRDSWLPEERSEMPS
jgi:hypothetical protein